ncbi:MAG: hypothetical protein N2C14_13745 [Planctomycetales bacterium]
MTNMPPETVHPSYDDLFRRLSDVADRMNELEQREDAELSFDLLAGAVLWSDECPKVASTFDQVCLRPVLRYRMSLILGKPEPKHFRWWEEAQRCFPRWPGFSPERSQPSDSIIAYYNRKNQEGLMGLELLGIGDQLKKEFDDVSVCEALDKAAQKNDPPDVTAGRIHKIVCAALRLAGRPIPSDSWERTRNCIAKELRIPSETIQLDSWIAQDLGGGWNTK